MTDAAEQPATHTLILLIEDNPRTAEMFTIVLEEAGYAVIRADRAESGLELAFVHQPELILMDLRLPGMSGQAAVRRLREDSRTAATVVVAITGEEIADAEDSLRGAGFDGYLRKPISTRTFPDLIAAYLRRGSNGPH